MPINETQLDTWSKQGSVTQSASTYQTISEGLKESAQLREKAFAVFLQGSYGNNTNVWAESDVDIVASLEGAWRRDIDALAPDERQQYEKDYFNASYGYPQFKADGVAALKAAFGSDVAVGNKAIAIAPRGNRRKADVLPAIQFRRYLRYRGRDAASYIEGILFADARGTEIINYPKLHAKNLTDANQASGGWLKPVVRIFKNWRSKLTSSGRLQSGIAPSYFIEGLLFNVPASRFGGNYQQSVGNVLKWILQEALIQQLLCVNKQHKLIADGTPTSWPLVNAQTFARALAESWNRD